MGKAKSIKTKILVVLIVFMLLFSSNGMTIAAIASSEEFEVINHGFFKKDEISFEAFFEDENGKKITDYSQDVNKKINLVLEISPQVKGFLRSGYIKAVQVKNNPLEKTDLNFKFSRIIENTLNGISYEDFEEELVEQAEEAVTPAEENKLTDAVSTPVEAVASDAQTSLADAVNNGEGTSTEEASIKDVTIEDVVENTEVVTDEDELVEEDEMIFDEEYEKVTIEDLIREAKLDIKIAADDEISLSNVIEDTRIVVELEFDKEENLKVSDLYKAIKLQLGGKFINEDLEEVKVGKEEEVTVGWDYSADVSLESEFIKTSPFELGDIKGTIVESKVTLTRDIDDENYLPIKNSRIEINVPKINDKYPTEVSVSANKLMATKGEDVGKTIFTEDNWKYNQGSGTIVISVDNLEEGVAKYTFGSDEYLITYRYEDIAEGSSLNLQSSLKAIVEEFSGRENHVITKEINSGKDVLINADELISFNISSTEDIINKAEIYANYNSVDPIYETEFTNQVDIHILTSDVLDNLKVDLTKNVYKDKDGIEFDATGIVYKQIKFNYLEIKNLLQNSGEIQVLSKDNELLYTLNGSLIENEEDCIIHLDNEEGIYLVAHDLAKNGLINCEITKAIVRPNIDKAVFRSIKYVEARASAVVKYAEIDADLPLATIATTKEFSESMTRANVTLNQKILSTTHLNENVEIKIELNNDKEDSDLYVKPSFEILFPKNINNVNIKNVNLISSDGLEIENYRTERQNDQTRLIVNLNGAQTQFSESQVTNGTNVIILADIEVDEYTPAKDDQIKLYYFNEAVSNYESQTKWSIERTLPNGVVKNTNGFDAVVIKYQAPSGMVPINGIVNFDGQLSEVKSVKEGMKTELIATNTSSRVVTMEVLALNNTGEDCKDVVMLGRIPFKGNKNVVTGEDLGTTATGKMMGALKEDVQNANTVSIYYSENGEASANINGENNGWTEKPESFENIKSFLIVVKGDMRTGTKLRYTYEYEIPENLPFDSKLSGSFGIFYEVEEVTNKSYADTVALETEKGPRLDVSLTSDIDENTEVAEFKRILYTVRIKNSGSIDAENILIRVPRPTYGFFTKTDYTKYGDFGYVAEEGSADKEIPIERLGAGEETTVTFIITVGERIALDSVVATKAIVTSSLSAAEIETNTVTHKIKDATFKTEVKVEKSTNLVPGGLQVYTLVAYNKSKEDLKNVTIDFNVTKNQKVTKKSATMMDHSGDTPIADDKLVYNEEEGKLKVNFGDMEKGASCKVDVSTIMNQVDEGHKKFDTYFDISADGKAAERSTIVPSYIKRGFINGEDNSEEYLSEVNEEETFKLTTMVSNVGADIASDVEMQIEKTDNVEIKAINSSSGKSYNYQEKDGKFVTRVEKIDPESTILVDLVLKTKNLSGNESSTAKITRTLTAPDQENILIGTNEVLVKNDKKTTAEKEAEIKENNKKTTTETTNGTNNKKNTNNTQPANTNTNPAPQQQEPAPVNNNTNTNTQPASTTPKAAYSISGSVWLDANENGAKDNDEKKLSNIKVYLYNSNNEMVKSTLTSSSGTYKYSNVTAGKYYLTYEIDQDKFGITTYKSENVDPNSTSRAIKVDKDLGAVSEEINLESGNADNINIGLVAKDIFDLTVNKYVSKINVTTKKGTEEYKYDNKDIAKVEIPSRYVSGAKVDIEYTIIIKNVGDIDGYVNNLVDYLPSGMTFDEKVNPNWYVDKEGNIFAKDIKNQLIKAGSEYTLKLILSKNMTADNVGTISNKIAIIDTYNNSQAEEKTDNNKSVQNTLVLISTGNTSSVIIVFVIGVIVGAIIALQTKRIDLSNISFNKNYKNDSGKVKEKKKTNILKRKYK